MEEVLRRYSITLKRTLTEQSYARTRKRTGTYAKSWRVVPEKGARLQVTNPARSGVGKPYAVYLEKGTRSHWVRPRLKKALRWRTGGRGPISSFVATKALGKSNFVFSRRGVYVLGINPRHVFRHAWAFESRRLPALIRDQIQKVFGVKVRGG
jgi:hypothetical protein